MKKLLSIVLTLTLLYSMVALLPVTASAATTGNLGNCSWKLDGTKLTISGNGKMGDLVEWPWGTNITELVINEGVTAVGRSAFYGCDQLRKVTLPETLKTIDDFAFNGCSSLIEITIPENVIYLGTNAFDGCNSLTDIEIPHNVSEIGEGLFYVCNDLMSITVDPQNLYYSSENGVLFDKAKTTLIRYPNKRSNSYTIPDSVKHIADFAFNECWYLENISIPDTVESIGYSAFLGTRYYNNKSNYIDGILYIGKHVIETDNERTSFNIREDTKVIANGAFMGCAQFKEIIIPNGVVTIGGSAFSWCTSLEKVYIPKSVKTIGESAFYDCDKLNVYYSGNEQDKNQITIDRYNDDIKLANWNYNACNLSEFHNYAIYEQTIATLTQNGSIDKICTNCLQELHETIYCPKVFTISATNYTYSGENITPSVIIIDTNGNPLEKDTDYTVSYPTQSVNIGTYNIVVELIGNYSGTRNFGFRINPVKTSDFTASLSTANYTYNGKVKTPSVTVENLNGDKLTKGVDYTVEYPQGRVKVGDYKVKVIFKGNYSGTEYLSFKINPIKSSKLKASLSTTTYTYNGKSKKPSVIVKNSNGQKLKKDVDYTVEYPKGRVKVGSYKVKIKFKGNYSGTKYLSFKINPAKTTVKKLTVGKKSLKVSIAKKSSQVTGYKIEYSTSKTFKDKYTKSKTINSYKTTSVTIKSLKAKKIYYVRVRTYKTVNGKKYYSAWSSYKHKKTK